ncbi:hypothetical protein [Sulfitobacter dubius]|uniref:hypothetical protein n=1 Tax=Sulfitobacter dubius TaxID=218673 RepID=UPI0030DCF39D
MADIVKLHRGVRPSSQWQVWAIRVDPAPDINGGDRSFAAFRANVSFWPVASLRPEYSPWT